MLGTGLAAGRAAVVALVPVAFLMGYVGYARARAWLALAGQAVMWSAAALLDPGGLFGVCSLVLAVWCAWDAHRAWSNGQLRSSCPACQKASRFIYSSSAFRSIAIASSISRSSAMYGGSRRSTLPCVQLMIRPRESAR